MTYRVPLGWTLPQALAYWHHRLDRNRPETVRRIRRVWLAGAGQLEVA